MATEGPNSPGTMADDATVGTAVWTNVNNAVSSNNVYATVTLGALEESHFLLATNFGFASVAGTVDGITAAVECSTTGANDFRVQLYSGGAFVGDNKATFAALPGADAYVTYGGAADTWSAGLSAANVLASGFGFGFSAVDSSGLAATVDVDHMRVTVDYTTLSTAMYPRMEFQEPHLAQRRLDVVAYRWGGREIERHLRRFGDAVTFVRMTRRGPQFRETRIAKWTGNTLTEIRSWGCENTQSRAPTRILPVRRRWASPAARGFAPSCTTC